MGKTEKKRTEKNRAKSRAACSANITISFFKFQAVQDIRALN